MTQLERNKKDKEKIQNTARREEQKQRNPVKCIARVSSSRYVRRDRAVLLYTALSLSMKIAHSLSLSHHCIENPSLTTTYYHHPLSPAITTFPQTKCLSQINVNTLLEKRGRGMAMFYSSMITTLAMTTSDINGDTDENCDSQSLSSDGTVITYDLLSNDDDGKDITTDAVNLTLENKLGTKNTKEMTISNKYEQPLVNTDDRKTSNSNATTPSSKIKIPEAASYKAITKFVSTTILIWLSEPLLSLIDTTVVGNFASPTLTTTPPSISIPSPQTIQLAALGPATMLCDNAFYLTYFLSIATTNQLAKSLAISNSRLLITTTSHVLGVAATIGVIITAIITGGNGAGGRYLLSYIIGSEGAKLGNGVDMTSSVVDAAFDYARIRFSVAPLVVMGIMAQSVCLATLDATTPALAVIGASLVNVVGDILLVAKWGMGIRGAAIATALAGVVSSLILLGEVNKKVKSWKVAFDDDEKTKVQHLDVISDEIENEVNSTDAALVKEKINGCIVKKTSKKKISKSIATLKRIWNRNKMKEDTTALITNETKNENALPPFISLPDPKSLFSLAKLAGPIFFVIVGKLIIYSAMSLKASDFGMLSLACHNVMLRIFFFFCSFGDSFNQATQSFLPSVLYATEVGFSRDSSTKMKTLNGKVETVEKVNLQQSNISQTKILLKRMLLLASVSALVNSQISKVILQKCGSIFTNDFTIQQLLRLPQHVYYLMGSVLLYPTVMIMEGTIIATRDLSFLVGAYGVTMAIMLSLLEYASPIFIGVWRALFIFQIIRLSLFGSRIWKNLRQKSESKTSS